MKAGDFSWSIPPTPRRTEYSASVFCPPSVDRAEIERLTGTYDDTPTANHDDEAIHFVWSRPLPADLTPEPGSELARRLTVDTQRWGGVSQWELISNTRPDLGLAIRKLADAHDLGIITVEDLYRDRATVLRFAERDGYGWVVDWRGPDEDGDEPYVPSPPGPKLPGWTMASVLDEWAVVYNDGAMFTIHADSMKPDGDIYRFEALTQEGQTVTMGWATIAGATTVLRGTPEPHDNPEATAILQQVANTVVPTSPVS